MLREHSLEILSCHYHQLAAFPFWINMDGPYAQTSRFCHQFAA